MKRKVWTTVAILAALGFLALVAIFVWDPTYIPMRAAKAYLFQAGIHEHFTTVNGHRIAYLESERKSNSEVPLLLVHGLGASKADWAPIMVPLTRAGFHVYALDLLGYGNSDAPQDADYSLQQEEDIVRGFMDDRKLQKADVAGWSMGGWVSMKLALEHPERVRRLVVLDSAGVYFPFAYADSLFTPTNRAELLELVKALEPDKPFISIPRWATSGILRRAKTKHWVIQRSFASMTSGRELLDFRLPRMTVPMLIVWGKEDKLIPFSSGERIHSLVPQSMLIGVRGCGHLAPGECSSQVAPLVEKYLKSPTPLTGELTVNGPSR